jgi:hypothetical protein
MVYGQMAGNKSVDAMIYRCFEYICEEDERKLVKKFGEQPPDGPQVMHTFSELVLGGYLASAGSAWSSPPMLTWRTGPTTTGRACWRNHAAY